MKAILSALEDMLIHAQNNDLEFVMEGSEQIEAYIPAGTTNKELCYADNARQSIILSCILPEKRADYMTDAINRVEYLRNYVKEAKL